MSWKVTFLGTGTSVGIPMIGCHCPTCLSPDPRDKRFRASIHVQGPECSWVVDTGPDFRQQCLRENIESLDAVLFTHSHADHIMGFDELRRFTIEEDASIPVYARPSCMAALAQAFHYAFDGTNRYRGYLKPDPRLIDGPFSLGKTTVTALPCQHGKVETVGYLFSSGDRPLFAYFPDCKSMDEAVIDRLKHVPVLILDALRITRHSTHLTIEEAIDLSRRIQPGQTWFTHFMCEVSQKAMEKILPPGISPAYDGLSFTID
jgi:phosphoribosyl 1,2-cyclic phosphate phosphodiesterase